MTFNNFLSYNVNLIYLYGQEFSNNVIKPSDPWHDCWIWVGKLNLSGYGIFKNGFFAHRISFLIYNGSIPEKWEIDHLCRNRKCVNPNHLEAVPREINQLRKLYMKNPWEESL